MYVRLYNQPERNENTLKETLQVVTLLYIKSKKNLLRNENFLHEPHARKRKRVKPERLLFTQKDISEIQQLVNQPYRERLKPTPTQASARWDHILISTA